MSYASHMLLTVLGREYLASQLKFLKVSRRKGFTYHKDGIFVSDEEALNLLRQTPYEIASNVDATPQTYSKAITEPRHVLHYPDQYDVKFFNDNCTSRSDKGYEYLVTEQDGDDLAITEVNMSRQIRFEKCGWGSISHCNHAFEVIRTLRPSLCTFLGARFGHALLTDPKALNFLLKRGIKSLILLGTEFKLKDGQYTYFLKIYWSGKVSGWRYRFMHGQYFHAGIHFPIIPVEGS